jgi:hypothetical protein
MLLKRPQQKIDITEPREGEFNPFVPEKEQEENDAKPFEKPVITTEVFASAYISFEPNWDCLRCGWITYGELNRRDILCNNFLVSCPNCGRVSFMIYCPYGSRPFVRTPVGFSAEQNPISFGHHKRNVKLWTDVYWQFDETDAEIKAALPVRKVEAPKVKGIGVIPKQQAPKTAFKSSTTSTHKKDKKERNDKSEEEEVDTSVARNLMKMRVGGVLKKRA